MPEPAVRSGHGEDSEETAERFGVSGEAMRWRLYSFGIGDSAKAHVQGVAAPWGYAIAGCIAIAGLVVWLVPSPPSSRVAPTAAVTIAQLQPVIEQRCAMCHNATLANKGVALHTPELIRQHAQAIYQQAVLQKTMPLNNATQMTDDERALITRWIGSLDAAR